MVNLKLDSKKRSSFRFFPIKMYKFQIEISKMTPKHTKNIENGPEMVFFEFICM